MVLRKSLASCSQSSHAEALGLVFAIVQSGSCKFFLDSMAHGALGDTACLY